MAVSRWVADVIRERTQMEWPPDVRKLAGAWSDFPSLSNLRKAAAADSARERL